MSFLSKIDTSIKLATSYASWLNVSSAERASIGDTS